MDEFLDEFEIQVDEPTVDEGDIKNKSTEEETPNEKKLESEGSNNDSSAEKKDDVEKVKEGKTKEGEEVKKEELQEAAKKASEGNNSGYKKIALKYLQNGTWIPDLAIEGADGEQILVSELEEIDEDTFFQIDEAVKNLKAEENKSKFISIEGIEDRRKNIIEIVKEGGDLTKIFSSPEQLNQYINPFSNMDLDDENVQARVYKDALIKYNKLDDETAQTVVEKAKKDLVLDEKVRSFVEQYTKSFDKFVETKKEELIKASQEEKKAQAEFKKNLREKYKALEIDEKLASKLAASAVNKVGDEFEIDSIYADKMENVDEAAELILFLTDKEAYLEMKMKDNNLKQQKKFRHIVNIIHKQQSKKSDKKDETQEDNINEFEIQVK